jgi:hypothetical protein
MRRQRSSDPISPDRTPPARTPFDSRNDLSQHPAQIGAPVVLGPRVLHHHHEVTTLLDIEDLSALRLSLRLDMPLDTETCQALTKLLKRADVHLDELSLTLSDTLDADALAALLATAEAHRDSLAPGGFQLQGTGGSLPDSLRVVIAGSRLCLELGAPTVRPLLFAHHLRPREEWVNANDGTQYALQDFLQCKAYLSDSEHHMEMVESLGKLAQKSNDLALMRACSVLSIGSQIQLSALPSEALCKLLVHWKIPYRLELHHCSEPEVHALARWLRQPRALFQGISLRGFPEVNTSSFDADCWARVFARLVAQPDLQGVHVVLTPSDQLPFLPKACASNECRLPRLLVSDDGSAYGKASERHAEFVAELTQNLNPTHLVLHMLTQTNIERVVDQLSKGSPNLLRRLFGLHLGWTSDNGFAASGRGLKRLFSHIAATDMKWLDGHPPDSDSECGALATRASGERLQVSLRPGPTYGLIDSTKVNSTLRFQRPGKEDSLRGAAEAMLQELLRKNDHHQREGEAALARKFIKESSFSPRDLNALARVSRATRRGGQAVDIVWVMLNLPADAPALRRWFKLPSGALDDELVNAVRTRLDNMKTPDPVWDLFLEATAP